MRAKKYVKAILYLIISIGIVIVYFSSYERETLKIDDLPYPDEVEFNLNGQVKYVISRPNCQMLNPSPWDDSIEKYLREPYPVVCSNLPRLTSVEQQDNLTNVLKINENVFSRYKIKSINHVKCCYNVITRVNLRADNYNNSADSLYELSNCTEFTKQVLLSNDTEFILVTCRSLRDGKKMKSRTIYKDVHPVVPILPEVSLKLKNATQNKPNVIILGIDSLSKLNLRRTMPRTLKYLQESRWIELNGYNKVGENTFPNLMAILSGEPMQSLEKKCWGNRSRKADDCPFIWREYSRKGYVTLYAEDTPSISTFNLNRTGFVEKPTDYYMRPFMVAAHDLLHKRESHGLPVCLGPVLVVDHILNYARKFFRAFNNHNYFSLLWLNSLTHNDVNTPRTLDISVHNFLQELAKIGTYNNAVVLFVSDHGSRFGEIREAFLGYLEERLPFAFIWIPKWFRKKHPDQYRNLWVNQNRLTAPYDLYVTLKKLLDDTTEESVSTACPKCNGLLEEQSLDRTCAEASIHVNWCLCSRFQQVPAEDKSVKDIAEYLYKYIVDQTDKLIAKENFNKSLCYEWKHVSVYWAHEIVVPNITHRYILINPDVFQDEELMSDTKVFVIIIQLSPRRTKFESTVSMRMNATSDSPRFQLLEAPKRLDSFYETSSCVDSVLLKQYCMCVRR